MALQSPASSPLEKLPDIFMRLRRTPCRCCAPSCLAGSQGARRLEIWELDRLTAFLPPLQADAEAVADEQHSDHELGINREAADCAIEWHKMPSQDRKS